MPTQDIKGYEGLYTINTEASRKLGFTRTGINHCALGQTNSCSGFIWKFI